MINIKPFLIGFASGIKDSFLGLLLLLNIDDGKTEKIEDKRPPGRRSARATPSSTKR